MNLDLTASTVRRLVLVRVACSLLSEGQDSIHYGSPLVASDNVVLVAVRTSIRGEHVMEAFVDGAEIWQQPTEYLFVPSFVWVPVYQPVLIGADGLDQRVYFAGPGGDVVLSE
jgi:hypothetical protein